MGQNKKVLSLFIIFIFTTIYTLSSAAQLPSGVSIHRLDNGMEVLLIRNPGLPMTGANMVVKVGSAYESFATSGMSHMLEHLLFNGTTTRTQKQLYDETDRIGGYNNANTSNYYTNYMMVTPSENFEKGLTLQADMLFNSTLPINKFKKEKGIVLEEISKSLAEPREQIERNLISIIFKGHALSLPTLGTYSTIKGMDRDEVYSFFKNNYVPNNMVLSVIGDFNTTEMLKMINRVYGVYKAVNVSRPDISEWITGLNKGTGENIPSGTWHRFYSGDEMIVHDLFMIDAELTPSYVKLVELLLKDKSKKIFKILDSKFSENLKNVKMTLRSSPFRNFIEVKTTLKKKMNTEKISSEIKSFMSSLRMIPDEAMISMEILKSKTDYLKNIEKPHMFGIYNAYNLAVHGIESILSLYNGSELRSAAEEVKEMKFSSSSITLIQNPSKEEDAGTESESTKTEIFTDPAKGKSLIVTNNGGSDLLAIHYMFKHKAMLESGYGRNIAKVLHQCFGNRLKSQDITKKTSEFGLTYKVNDNPFFPMDDIYLHPDFGYIRVEGIARNVPAVITILNSELKNFTPSEEEFKRAYSEIKRMRSPMMMGNMAKKIFDKIYSSEVLEENKYKPGPADITYDNLVKFSKEYFNSGNIIIAVSSPENTKKIDNSFENFFSEGKQDEPSPWSPGFMLRDKPKKIEKDGMGKRSYLFWGYTKKIDPGDRAALQALSLFLSDRIVFDIREKRGMAYRMSAGIKLREDKALFFINMGTRPENREKLLPDFPGFFNKNSADNLTNKGLERLVSMYLGRMKFRRLSSINRAYYLSHSLYFNGNINSDNEFFKKLKEIKAADVKKAAKKYLGPENPLTIIVR